jgi:hypothetical protein
MAGQPINAAIIYGPLASQKYERPAQMILFATENCLEETSALLENCQADLRGR